MGIRLCMTLRAPAKAAPAMTAERAEEEPAERLEGLSGPTASSGNASATTSPSACRNS
jgi:hypothetical protein